MSAEVRELLTNRELLATLSQDPLVSRAKLVYQAPAPLDSAQSWGAHVPANGCGYANCSSGQLPPGPTPPAPHPFVPPTIKLQAWVRVDHGVFATMVLRHVSVCLDADH